MNIIFLRIKKYIASNNDVDAAEKMILDNLKWRKERNMDGIHKEDWSDMESLYPYIIKGLDKEGKPCNQNYYYFLLS